jgi:predicted HTH domain antitoxin
VKLLVPEGAGFRDGRIQHYRLVLDLDLQDRLVIDHFGSTARWQRGTVILSEASKLKGPSMQEVLQSLNKNRTDALFEIIYPLLQVKEVVEVELVDDFLDFCKLGL